LAENNKKFFEPQFTWPVDASQNRQGQAQGKREVNRDVEIAPITEVAGVQGSATWVSRNRCTFRRRKSDEDPEYRMMSRCHTAELGD
jgi:hypothetical protein